VVIPVLSSKSSISCKIEKKQYFGYLRWNGGASNLAYVDEVPRHAHFKLYERVVTSGYSSVFPQGIPVGKILHVFNSPDGLSYRLQVQLYTDFGNLRDVCVIDNTHMHEQLEILRAAQDSLSTKNKE
jgi:rod shape-determining protein MreC